MAGPQCCANPPTLNPNSGAGSVEQLAGLKTYVSGSPTSNFAILLISDVHGNQAPNLRRIADKIAAAGFFVAVPDFFYGDHFVYDNVNRPLQVWLRDHGTDKGFEDAKSVVEALKSKGFSALGAAGFCWGAKVVTELSKSKSIEAAVLLHPSFVTVNDIKEVNVPMAILGAEFDDYGPPALLKQFEEILAAKPEADSYVEIFPNVVHGWTVKYKDDDEATANSAKEAHNKMLDWFSKYVK